ncbi:MAG TPA: ComF family protein, partial [Hyphomicrobiaceae bacterium]|nr:ComF family protein [Hyphomicrobiaceae bacterium]
MTLARLTTRAVGFAARAITDTLIPPACVACREPLITHDTVCAACWSDIAFIQPPLCDRLGIPLPFDPGSGSGGPLLSAPALANPPAYDRARVVAAFSGVMRDLIHGLKYADRHDAKRLFGRWLHQAANQLLDDTHLIMPVPLHPGRLLSRRYNQSALLAIELARLSGRPYEPMILRRRRRTISQVGLSRDQRRRNLQGAFAVPPTLITHIADRNILL